MKAVDSKPVVSLIMPVYNTAPYLSSCLESVLNQDWTDFELIAVDDGSDDESPTILSDFSGRDRRVRILTKKNEGQGIARNMGFAHAQGQFTAFVDSDDILHPSYLSTLMKTQAAHDADAVYCRYRNFSNGEIPRSESIGAAREEKTGPRRALMGFEACPPLYLFRRSCLQAARLSFPGFFHEDEAEIFRLLLHCDTIVNLEACLYHYRRHAASTTGLKPNRRTADIVLVVKRLLEIAGDHPDYRLEFEYKAYAMLAHYEGVWKEIGEDWANKAIEESRDLLAGLRRTIADNPYQFIREAAKREYESSLSWRLTRPLRLLKNAARRK